MKIIDVSEFQKNIDWERVKSTGYGAILRLGIRGSVKGSAYYGKIRKDFYFDQNLAGVKKNGIKYSVYFFPTSINDEEAAQEATWIIEQIKDLSLSFPVWLDSERVDAGKGRADNLDPEKRTHLLRVICDHLEYAGIPCGIYASTYWLENNLIMSKFSGSVRKNTWVAQNPKLTYKGAACLWQYGKTSVPGVKGDCDINETLTAFDMGARKNEVQNVAYYRSVIVDKAKSYIGAGTGSAKHKQIIDTYNSRKPLPRGYAVKFPSDAWCATFVSAIAIMCKYTAIIPVECSCPQMITLAKQMGIWTENDAHKPKPGDIILYDWQDSGQGDNTGTADHIGYVEKLSGSTITVIEGNMGSAGNVGRRSIQVNGKYIRGYITPKYTTDAPPKQTAKKVDLSIKLPELHPGDTGEAVRLWQFLTGADVTGTLDENQVKKWQKANGKTVDGWVGKGCWTKLFQIKKMM